MDQDLLQKIHQGDERAFALFVSRHKDMLVDYCFQMTGVPSLSHEIALEVLAEIHQTASRRGALAEPVRWMMRRATARIHAAERRAKYRNVFRAGPKSLPPLFEAGISPGDGAPQWQQMMREEVIRKALATLPIDFRQVLTLCEIMQMEIDQVAKLTGDTPAEVVQKVERARDALANALQTMGGR